jgi:hypothetical protein
LTGDFVGADIVRNEITAQARASVFIDPDVTPFSKSADRIQNTSALTMELWSILK